MVRQIQTFLHTPSLTRSRIAGTAAKIVGPNIEASPFVPLFILFDVSVNVKGDPYPSEAPTATTMFYNINMHMISPCISSVNEGQGTNNLSI